MEAATHAVAPKTSNMCDTHTVCEAAPAEMSGTRAAIHTYGATHAMIETAASEMRGTYAVVKTHAVMCDGPLGADAHMAEAVAVPAIKYSTAGIVVIAKVIRACRGTAVSRIVHRPRRTGVLAGIGLQQPVAIQQMQPWTTQYWWLTRPPWSKTCCGSSQP